MNKFDYILWRINGALLFVFLVLGIIFFYSNRNQPGPRASVRQMSSDVPQPVAKEEDKAPENRNNRAVRESIRLGSPFRMAGTPFLRLPLQSEIQSVSDTFTTTEKVY